MKKGEINQVQTSDWYGPQYQSSISTLYLSFDILRNNDFTEIKFSTSVKNIHMEGTVSQIIYLGLSFDFIEKVLLSCCLFLIFKKSWEM